MLSGRRHRSPWPWWRWHRCSCTFDAPLRVVRVHTPPYLRDAGDTPTGRQRRAHRPLCRFGLAQPMLLAGHAGHALPAGRAPRSRRPTRSGGPVGAGAPGLGPPDPDRPDSRSAPPAGTPANWRRCAGPAGLAGEPGGHHRAPAAIRSTPRDSSPRCSACAPVFDAGLGVEGAAGGGVGATRHRRLPWRCRSYAALPAPRHAADDGALRAVRGGRAA